MSVWYELGANSLVVGEAAYEERIEQALPGDLVPLADLLMDKTPIGRASEYATPIYENNQPREDLIRYAGWILRVVQSEDPDARLSVTHLDNAARLGLGPFYSAFYRRKLRLDELRDKLGNNYYSAPGTFDGWTTENFIQNAQELTHSEHLGGRKPKALDYLDWAKQRKGPSPALINEHIPGGITELNQYLGFRDWGKATEDDYISWGVRVMRANQGRPLDTIAIRVLSRRGRGPADVRVYKNFDSVPAFSERVAAQFEYEQDVRLQHAGDMLEEFKQLDIQGRPECDRWGDERKQAFAAKCALAKSCLPFHNATQIFNLAKLSNADLFVEKLRHARKIRNDVYRTELTVGEIELSADELGVFDDIWQLYPGDSKDLHVSETDVQEMRDALRVKQINRRKAIAINRTALPHTCEQAIKVVE